MEEKLSRLNSGSKRLPLSHVANMYQFVLTLNLLSKSGLRRRKKKSVNVNHSRNDVSDVTITMDVILSGDGLFDLNQGT
jgi:hypothetical protein